LARQHAAEPVGSPTHRALQQAGRSLLLAQASDWPFILKSGTSTVYAEQRVRDLLARFNYLDKAIEGASIDERHLQALEQLDAIFPNLDYQGFIEQE
jgi:1,4-alpha-glucan branching enzyme